MGIIADLPLLAGHVAPGCRSRIGQGLVNYNHLIGCCKLELHYVSSYLLINSYNNDLLELFQHAFDIFFKALKNLLTGNNMQFLHTSRKTKGQERNPKKL